jgi:hypothetical protein
MADASGADGHVLAGTPVRHGERLERLKMASVAVPATTLTPYLTALPGDSQKVMDHDQAAPELRNYSPESKFTTPRIPITDLQKIFVLVSHCY